MINPLSISLSGMMSASKKLEMAAVNIANANSADSTINIDQEMISTLEAKQSYDANATVLAKTKQMQDELGRIFDKKA